MSEQGFVLAIDQSTTSTRAIVFDHAGHPVAIGQREHDQIFPQPGWVEHDPRQILNNLDAVIAEAIQAAGISPSQLVAVGVTNQRESVVVWDRQTGEPVYNVIVWQDMRTAKMCDEFAGEAGASRFQRKTGLALVPYVSAPKVAWVLDNVPGVRQRAEAGELILGTMDSWVIWHLTGGAQGGLHITDVTNASRTCLMDLATLRWDDELCAHFGIPRQMLPEIKSCSQVYGYGAPGTLLAGVPIAGSLGDQQAASFGQGCFTPGMAKNTYGTGCFLLLNTGTQPVFSSHGLLTTVAYQFGDQPASYALEGSIAVTGSLVQWLRDNIGLISKASEIEQLAAAVPDNGGAYLVPAFSGLFAPYWRPDARGILVGLTRYVNKHHIARAALEATCYQTRDVVEAMNSEGEISLAELRVDGGMTANELLMQFQADQLGVPVVRPVVTETTALGAAYAAGLAVGFWAGTEDVSAHWAEDKRWVPRLAEQERAKLYAGWAKAIERSLNWQDLADE